MADKTNKPRNPLEEQAAKKRPGRPGRDWDALFAAWLKSGLPRKDFLKLNGIDWRGGTAAAKTAGWERAIDETQAQLTEMKMSAMAAAGVARPRVAAVVDAVVEEPGKEPRVPGTSPANSWQHIQAWRSTQASQDWKMTDSVRMHIALLLKRGLRRHEDGGWESTLKAGEVRMLALAAADVQRVQRLALGLSTENIGIDGALETHIDGEASKAEGEKPANLFVVELTRNGKFTRARPRRVG